jgi:hypothetical protein
MIGLSAFMVVIGLFLVANNIVRFIPFIPQIDGAIIALIILAGIVIGVIKR